MKFILNILCLLKNLIVHINFAPTNSNVNGFNTINAFLFFMPLCVHQPINNTYLGEKIIKVGLTTL